MGEMDASEAKSHPDKNIITRAVGAFEDLAIDFFEEHVEPGDVILMCTDGLSNMVDDTDIRQMIQRGTYQLSIRSCTDGSNHPAPSSSF